MCAGFFRLKNFRPEYSEKYKYIYAVAVERLT